METLFVGLNKSCRSTRHDLTQLHRPAMLKLVTVHANKDVFLLVMRLKLTSIFISYFCEVNKMTTDSMGGNIPGRSISYMLFYAVQVSFMAI